MIFWRVGLPCRLSGISGIVVCMACPANRCCPLRRDGLWGNVSFARSLLKGSRCEASSPWESLALNDLVSNRRDSGTNGRVALSSDIVRLCSPTTGHKPGSSLQILGERGSGLCRNTHNRLSSTQAKSSRGSVRLTDHFCPPCSKTGPMRVPSSNHTCLRCQSPEQKTFVFLSCIQVKSSST